MSGAVGGAIGLAAVFPSDYPRVMLVRMKGIKDLYKHFWVYLIPILFCRGLTFGIFDTIHNNSKSASSTPLNLLVLSMFANFSSLILTAPL